MNDVVISKREYSGERDKDELELPFFDYHTIVMSTNKFADENKLGQGGFGIVYKVNIFLKSLEQHLSCTHESK